MEAHLPVHVDKYDIEDGPPTEEEVVECLSRLLNQRAAGASGITAETVKGWHRNARPLEDQAVPVPSAVLLLDKVLEIIKLAFVDGVIPRAFSHGIMVLIPKDKPCEYRGIALLEIITKLISSSINRRISSKVIFDDALHRFRTHRGTATGILEAKLQSQLSCSQAIPYYMIILDLKKAYDTLDRGQALIVLKGYGVGANLFRLLQTIWEGDTMIQRQAGYFERPFKANRGVSQGDILSPLIFNIMVYEVVRNWRSVLLQRGTDETVIFYTDDGLISGTLASSVQGSMDFLTRDFLSLGLRMNP